MLVERTSYVPSEGAFDAVLAIRRCACDIRRDLGLRTGEIFVEDGETGGEMVHWECPFETEEQQRADLAARADSAAFTHIRTEMEARIAGFERRLFRRVAAQPSVLRQTELDGHPIVPREITFRSGDLDLTGYLFVPPGEGPFPCLVTNHGSGIEQGTWDLCRPGMAALLMSWGIAVFLPHRRGYGNSPGAPWLRDVPAPFGTPDYDAQLSTRLAVEAEDVVAALTHLEGLSEIDAEHIGVMGSSFGGTVTLLASAACPRFRCAVDFAGAAINWNDAPGLRETMTAATRSLDRPIFFIQAETDYSTRPTVELAAAAAKAGVEVQSRVYPVFGLTKTEGHLFQANGTVLWQDDVRAFLERWL